MTINESRIESQELPGTAAEARWCGEGTCGGELMHIAWDSLSRKRYVCEHLKEAGYYGLGRMLEEADSRGNTHDGHHFDDSDLAECPGCYEHTAAYCVSCAAVGEGPARYCGECGDEDADEHLIRRLRDAASAEPIIPERLAAARDEADKRLSACRKFRADRRR